MRLRSAAKMDMESQEKMLSPSEVQKAGGNCESNQSSASVHEEVFSKEEGPTIDVADSNIIDNEDEVQESEDNDGFELADEDEDEGEDEDDAYEFISDDFLTIHEDHSKSSPFLQLNMGEYTKHPRLRSLTKSQVDEAEDPVSKHINVVEARFREDFRVAIQ